MSASDWPIEPSYLPADAEAWAMLAERCPALLSLHIRAASLRHRGLARRREPWLQLAADLDNLPLTDAGREFARRVLARAGRVERLLLVD